MRVIQWNAKITLCACFAALVWLSACGNPPPTTQEEYAQDAAVNPDTVGTPETKQPEQRKTPPETIAERSTPPQCPASCANDTDCPASLCGALTACIANQCQTPVASCPSRCRADQDCGVADCGNRTSCQAGVCTAPSVCGPCNTGAGTICDPTSKQCVQCLQDSHCTSDQRCDATTKACVPRQGQCSKDEDCAKIPGRPLCHPNFAICAQCITKAQCPSWQICFDDPRACGQDTACLQRLFTCIADPKGCSSDAGCPTGKHCEVTSKQCVECTSDAHCPADKRCDSVSQMCRANSSFCKNDSECAAGKHCLVAEARCVDCLAGSDCKAGEICTALYTCQAVGACQMSSDCQADQICQTGSKACVGCTSDADCPWDQRCDTQGNACVACISDSDCGSRRGLVCEQFACKSGCRTASQCPQATPYCLSATAQTPGTCAQCTAVGLGQCPQGERCDVATGACKPQSTTSCQSAQDCVLGSYCDIAQKMCITGCQTDRDCPTSARYCDVISKSCASCANDGHCQKGQICDASQKSCIPGCRTSRDCNTSTPLCDQANQVCYRACASDADCANSSQRFCDLTRQRCVGCRGPQDCNGGQVCKDEQCIYQPCTTDTDCPTARYCHPTARLCYPGCYKDTDCTKAGEICLQNICKLGCRSNTDCPNTSRQQDRYCIELQCRECRSQSDCSGGLHCSPNGYCFKGCDLNGGDAYCRAVGRSDGKIRCDKANGLCFQCQFDAHCNKGESCIESNCVVTRLSTLCKACQTDTDCVAGSLCLGFPCEKSPKERACAAACDANDKCPTGYKCVSIVRSGRSNKQCVPLLYRDSCDGAFAGTCAGVKSIGQSCLPGTNSTSICGLKGVNDAFCSTDQFECKSFCRQDADCPTNHTCKSCDMLSSGPFGNECNQIPSSQRWSVCVYQAPPQP